MALTDEQRKQGLIRDLVRERDARGRRQLRTAEPDELARQVALDEASIDGELDAGNLDAGHRAKAEQLSNDMARLARELGSADIIELVLRFDELMVEVGIIPHSPRITDEIPF